MIAGLLRAQQEQFLADLRWLETLVLSRAWDRGRPWRTQFVIVHCDARRRVAG